MQENKQKNLSQRKKVQKRQTLQNKRRLNIRKSKLNLLIIS